MKQTFEIEHNKFTSFTVNELFDLLEERYPNTIVGIATVTGITEYEKCEFSCCNERIINKCPYVKNRVIFK